MKTNAELQKILQGYKLTQREAEVAILITKGLTNKEVGNHLFITEGTVKFHLTNIYEKMRVSNRRHLIMNVLEIMEF